MVAIYNEKIISVYDMRAPEMVYGKSTGHEFDNVKDCKSFIKYFSFLSTRNLISIFFATAIVDRCKRLGIPESACLAWSKSL